MASMSRVRMSFSFLIGKAAGVYRRLKLASPLAGSGKTVKSSENAPENHRRPFVGNRRLPETFETEVSR